MAPAISKPLSNLVAQIGKIPSCSCHIRAVGDRPDLANVDNGSGTAGIPLVDLNPNGPERLKVAEAAIGRLCESDGFFMVTNHGVPAPAGVVEGMLRLRVGGELFHFHFHLPESESELKCGYSDDPTKARALQPSHMAVYYYCLLPCPQPDYGLPVHKDLHAIITQLLQDQQEGLLVQRGSRWTAVDHPVPVPANALVINLGDQMQVINDTSINNLHVRAQHNKAIELSTSFNVRPHCYPLESFVEQYPPSSFRAACNVLGENIHRVIQRCVGSSSPSYCLPITVNDPSPYGSESPFSLEKNDVTNEATDEDVSKFDLAAIAGTLSLVVPVAIDIDELTTTWTPLWKVLCGIFMIMSLMLAFIGLFTASFRSGSRARNLSSHCARMSLVLAAVIFMFLIASKLGCVGCAAGVTIVLVMLVLTILWIRCEHGI